ncbi:lipopolysaccharide biosynthesis protein [Arthrobacter sp. VKM Ac-2550]|uniref:lipopolysaccharide biosynthesis protein n=1 Tax=Crystallibacter permensis TaxID=1938888 RepID=UPI002225D51B|nr:oligosaccharide flippase family protein [Arthrobacter sp. VKM Ac-2550]MCW2131637.1 Membrane protein involved in the export of O-antigen and teichoic acid [Arthrobacter sp. VKM Ac-2550]
MVRPEGHFHADSTATRRQREKVIGPSLFGRGLLYVVVWSLQLVAGIIVSPVLAHTLAPAEFGALAAGIALHQAIAALALFGFDRALVLQRAEDNNNDNARGLIAVGMSFALLVTVVFALTAPLWRGALGFGQHAELVYAVILWTVPAASVQVMLSLLLAEDKFRPFALVSGLAAIGGQVVGLILLFGLRNDAGTYALGAVGSQIAAMLVGIVLTRPSLRGLANWRVTRRALKLGLPLTLAGIAYFQLSAGDRIIVQMILGAEEVGRYQAAYVIGSIVVLLITFTGTAWTPRFAALVDNAERWELATRARDELYRVLMPVILGVTLAAPFALQIVVPQSFRPETLTGVVFLIALSAFPVAAGAASCQLLLTQRRGSVIGLMTGVAAMGSIGLNLLLVPLWGIFGAATAAVAAYMLLAFLQRIGLPKTQVWRRPTPNLIAAVLAVILLASATTLIPQSPEWNLVRLAFAFACLPWFIRSLRSARSSLESFPDPGISPPATDQKLSQGS